jgi:hypothetical protein
LEREVAEKNKLGERVKELEKKKGKILGVF